MHGPTFADILDARRLIAPYITRTPLRRYPALCELIGADVWVKHENYQVLGAFKVRGGLNLIGRTGSVERRQGFITASTGNHGQSIAYAASTFGAACTVVVPNGANPVKVRAIEALGATVVHHGEVFERAREHAERLSAETGARYVHPANEPLLIAGVATYSLEIHEDLSGVDYLIVPLGAGSGASGACIVSDAVSPGTRVIAVQSEGAPAGYQSWKQGVIVTTPMATMAEGLATAQGYELPQSILRDRLDDFVLVSDDRIREAICRYVECARTLVEAAGAASLAAAMDMKDKLRGRRVVLVASGGNITTQQLRSALEFAQTPNA
jgi:threonine dehydratase